MSVLFSFLSVSSILEFYDFPSGPYYNYFLIFQYLISIIQTRHHYAYFAQFDWLEKKFYTSINSMSKNLRTIFLPLAPEICSVDKNRF